MDRLRVAVIGAGAVGAGIAAALAERGSTVTLIDQNSPGAGTSAATFGWANANGKEPYSYFEINRLGLEAHHRSAARGGTWLGTPGHVEIAATAEHAARLQERVERLRSREYPAETLSIVRAQELLPGIRVPRDAELIAHFAREAYVYPALYVAESLRRARADGAAFRFGSAVIGLERRRSGAAVALADGTVIDVDVVVSAVGRWTSELTAGTGVEAPLLPFAHPGDATVGYLLETLPAPVLLDRIVTSPELNLRPEGGGRLLLQALDLDASADPGAIPALDSAVVAEFCRRLSDIAVGGEFARPGRLLVGQRAIPADGHTISGVGVGSEWLYVVATHSGVTLAPFLAEAVADELHGIERHELADFRPSRFADAPAMASVAAPRRPGEQ